MSGGCRAYPCADTLEARDGRGERIPWSAQVSRAKCLWMNGWRRGWASRRRCARSGQEHATHRAGVRRGPKLPATFLSAAPKVLMSSADVAASEPLGPAAAPHTDCGWPVSAQEFAAAIAETRPGQRLETIRELRPEVRSTLERPSSFSGLQRRLRSSLAVVAIVLALRRYLKRELDTGNADFRTLGRAAQAALILCRAILRAGADRLPWRAACLRGAGGAGVGGTRSVRRHCRRRA